MGGARRPPLSASQLVRFSAVAVPLAAAAGLPLVFALGPAIAHALSAALIARFPLDEAGYAEIRRQLDPGPPDYAFAE